jgi:oxepin-CoA hydrolase/3-oxo-5,6-dehydrosuberyl-CoA semialdehyde dehydrogenase
MKTLKLLNYERDRWVAGDGIVEIASAIDGAPVATTGSGGIDFANMLRHAREVGGPALRKLTFHDRARMIKALGLAIMARK